MARSCPGSTGVSSAREEILDWAGRGRIAPGRIRAALAAGGVLPTPDQWRRFLDRFLLYAGAVLIGAGVIFFFAYNWQELGRLARFALAEIPLVVVLVFLWRWGVDRPAGQALLLGASLLVGALLALIGQTYQTGADVYELFAAWAVAILPWVWVARFPALWIFWLVLVNVALAQYFQAGAFRWGLTLTVTKALWLHFGLNTAALILWEVVAASTPGGRRERWAVRLLAAASCALVTALAVLAVAGRGEMSLGAVVVWLAWLGAAYFAYRVRTKDLFVLAAGVLAVIAFVVGWITRHIQFDGGMFLLVGALIVALAAAGGWWLRELGREDES